MDFEHYIETKEGHLPHAFLLEGPGDLRAPAVKLAAEIIGYSGRRKVLAGIHPDVTVVEPDNGVIKVDAVRSLRADTFVLPNEAERKVFVLLGADAMNLNAANALLKILEEPPQYASFILTAQNPGAIPSTVLSRCVRLMLPPNEIPAPEELVRAANDLGLILSEKNELKLFCFLSALEKSGRDGIRAFCAQAAALMADAVRVSCALESGGESAVALAKAFSADRLSSMGMLLSETAAATQI
jgi:DNA polymerase III delta prime subunit